jgi:hypothetical protein
MIYLTNSSLWWLILPSIFTALDSPQLRAQLSEETRDEFGMDTETKKNIEKFLEQERNKRGKW